MARFFGDTITLNDISIVTSSKPKSVITSENCLNFQMNFTLTGGTFSISVLLNSCILPPENFIISLPFGMLGVVKGTGTSFSSGGLVNTITGPIIPFALQNINFTGIPPGALFNLAQLAGILSGGVGVNWSADAPLIKSFLYRGVALSGIQQLAQNVLADVIVYKNGLYVVPAGVPVNKTPYVLSPSDIVSASQVLDYSLDRPSVLNPALTAVNVLDNGNFVYDSLHAQKQPRTTVQCGAPGSQGSQDFIPIPDGWAVDGTFEEWVPTSPTDFTNPDTTAVNGRYWKVFQSPTNPSALRGILSFSRLVRQIVIPGNVSTFIGSPVTGSTGTGSGNTMVFQDPGSEGGIYGFTAEQTTLQDAISGQYLTFPNAIVLAPPIGDSGDAASNFFTIQMEIWTFPRVLPTIFPTGGKDPNNPFNIPSNVVVVTPPSIIFVAPGPGNTIFNFYNYYLAQYRQINSPRLRAQIQFMYRNIMVFPGDQITCSVMPISKNCGRINASSIVFGRSGVVVNATAELYNFQVPGGNQSQKFVIEEG